MKRPDISAAQVEETVKAKRLEERQRETYRKIESFFGMVSPIQLKDYNFTSSRVNDEQVRIPATLVLHFGDNRKMTLEVTKMVLEKTTTTTDNLNSL